MPFSFRLELSSFGLQYVMITSKDVLNDGNACSADFIKRENSNANSVDNGRSSECIRSRILPNSMKSV